MILQRKHRHTYRRQRLNGAQQDLLRALALRDGRGQIQNLLDEGILVRFGDLHETSQEAAGSGPACSYNGGSSSAATAAPAAPAAPA
eukprot:CAMPEP_0177531894 /NCGR_PEP_ID=MMETSP0369-20130122/54308_1 /TAXON_ID=447022 ORGANISM="Scrippsiella hangoei-like, Strain SHHI-4" /NCGR_SAMPLE_ID=MMETSP0369 /ASSEMBLY_ACC=CAM_ASM_000364 /LENGTH=86 /DNA_ID=CAMNT_0019013111 /DNA_START=150 /DNA_END=406 /DNA_ORIENTATION=-